MKAFNYNNIISSKKDYDSKDELYFTWYLDELVEDGYVKEYHRGSSIDIGDAICSEYNVVMKTKYKNVSRTLVQPATYTPDYIILWNDKALNVFCRSLHHHRMNVKLDKPDKYPFIYANDMDVNGSTELVSIVDVKPSINQKFVKFTSTHTFVYKQILFWNAYNMFIDKIKVQDLFKKTFTPKRYFLTDKSMVKRKIKWPTRVMSSYVALIDLLNTSDNI